MTKNFDRAQIWESAMQAAEADRVVDLLECVLVMLNWADDLEAEAPTGRFFAQEIRNRLAARLLTDAQ